MLYYVRKFIQRISELGCSHLRPAHGDGWLRKNGESEHPQAYKTKGGHSLGLWILIQRVVREQDRWPEYFAAAEAYAREFGHLCVLKAYVIPDGVRLSKWLGAMNVQHKR